MDPSEINPLSGPTMRTTHHGLTLADYHTKHDRLVETTRTLRQKIDHCRKRCQCSRSCFVDTLYKRVPVINVLQTYHFKEYILGDIVGGLSLGVMQIPQGLGYALLASLPPIIGLYTSFFPVILYCLLGTSRHLSMGTMALNSLIIGTAVRRETAKFEVIHGVLEDNVNNTDYAALLESTQIGVAMSVSFVAGICMFLMGAFGLGFIVTFISDPFMSGYLTGANMHVLTHQVKYMFGIKVGSFSGALSYFYLVIDIFKNIVNTNIATLIISVICFVLLFVIKTFVNDRYKARLKIPVPIELIVVVVGTTISYLANFEQRFGVFIINHVPKGFPYPSAPDFQSMPGYILDGFILALVSYTLAIMMVKLFADRHNYPYDANQELLAQGLCSTVGSFFSCMTASCSPPRCFLMESTGGRTQVAYFISAILILLTLFFIAPLLEALPVCILACLILVSCIPLFEHYKICVYYWRVNKYDFAVWLVSMAGTLCVGVDIGILIGVGFSCFVVIYRTQKPYIVAKILEPNDNVLLDTAKYKPHGKWNDSIKIISFEMPIYFATLEILKEKLYKLTVKPADVKYILANTSTNGDIPHNNMKNIDVELEEITTNQPEDQPNAPLTAGREKPPSTQQLQHYRVHNSEGLQVIILDCSAVSFIDTPGAKLLATLYKDYKAVEIDFVLVALSETVYAQLCCVPQCSDLVLYGLYPTVQDALLVKDLVD